MSRVSGKGSVKVLVAGLGWGFAELVLTRLVFLWVGARGVEFDWKYIHNAVTWQYSSNLADYELERNFLPKGVSMVTASTVNSRFQDSVSEVKEQVIDYLNAKPSAKLGLVIADALYGLGKEKWDSPSDMWKAKEFEEVIDFLKVRESF